MDDKIVGSLDKLPIELIYSIFNYLDTRTIVRIVRCVCKRLYQSVNSYSQYHLDFQSINRSDFLFVCNYIKHDKVVSLKLNDNDQTPGQIEYFLSLYRLNSFTKLRYLSLNEIDDCYLNILLKDIKTNELNTLIIHSQRDYSQNNTNSNDFSLVLSLSTLKHFHLNIPSFDSSQIQWPNSCQIEHLEINCRRLEQYYEIVRHLPSLRKLVLLEMDEQFHDGISFPPDDLEGFHQLECLILKNCSIDIILFEILLSLTPSIKSLQLIQSIDLHEFTSNLNRLEKFIQLKLNFLENFQFFLIDRQIFFNGFVDASTIIKPFQRPFWTEIKQWFVRCDYYSSPRTILLYTPPLFDPQFILNYQSKLTYRLTSLPTNDKQILTNGLRKLHLNLEGVMTNATSPVGGGLTNSPVYPDVEELRIDVQNQWPMGSLRFLSTLIDLSKIVKCTLNIHNFFYYYSQFIINIEKFFQLTKNLQSLSILISSGFSENVNDQNLNIISVIPKHVKHLSISVSTIKQMQFVVHQLKSLSSIKLQYVNHSYDPSDVHLNWLKRENGYYTYKLHTSYLALWFNHRNNS